MSDTKLDSLTPVKSEHSTADSIGVIAQEIDDVMSTGYFIDTGTMAGTTVSVTGTVSSVNNNWANGNSITLTDPYEEMEKRLAKLEQLVAAEAEIRASHPAVKMAYDEYRLLLVLANRNLTDKD